MKFNIYFIRTNQDELEELEEELLEKYNLNLNNFFFRILYDNSTNFTDAKIIITTDSNTIFIYLTNVI